MAQQNYDQAVVERIHKRVLKHPYYIVLGAKLLRFVLETASYIVFWLLNRKVAKVELPEIEEGILLCSAFELADKIRNKVVSLVFNYKFDYY
jgi:hypothetical protein